MARLRASEVILKKGEYCFYSKKYPSQKVVLSPSKTRREGPTREIIEQAKYAEFSFHFFKTSDEAVAKILREHPMYGREGGWVEIGDEQQKVEPKVVLPKSEPSMLRDDKE